MKNSINNSIHPKILRTLKNQLGIEKYPEIPEHLKLFRKEHGIFSEVDFEDALAPHILKIVETLYPSRNAAKIPVTEKLETISSILGLSAAETKVIVATWRSSKSLTAIQKLTSIPKGSLNSILGRLEKRGLISKNPRWRANIHKAISRLRACL